MPSSPRFCAPRGTSFGFLNAAQKKTITASMHSTAISIGLVKWKEPTEKSGWKLKFCSPGAGNPQPLKRWHPPAASATTRTSPIIGHSLHPSSPVAALLQRAHPAVAVNDEAHRDPKAEHHADRKRPFGVDGLADPPADGTVGDQPGDHVAEHGPAGAQAERAHLRLAQAAGAPGHGVLAVAAHVSRHTSLLRVRFDVQHLDPHRRDDLGCAPQQDAADRGED